MGPCYHDGLFGEKDELQSVLSNVKKIGFQVNVIEKNGKFAELKVFTALAL